MHGIGNDYLYLDAVANPAIAARPDLPELARHMSDRHTGVGSDGLIVIQRPDPRAGIPEGHGVRMRMFNADGSESEMCGNGIRCVAKYAVEHELVTRGVKPVLVQTGAGVLALEYRLDRNGEVSSVTVDMGEPVLELPRIPVAPQHLTVIGEPGGVSVLEIDGPRRRRADPPKRLEAVFVSMGNPHAVFFHPDVVALDLAGIGPRVETHPAFPKRVNVHFVEVVSRGEMTMRTWERGSGITRACGTGAAAVCVAGVLRNRTERRVLIHLPGGDLELEWNAANHRVYKTGPAVEVFSGEWPE